MLCVARRDNLAYRLINELRAGPCVEPQDADGIERAIERLVAHWRSGTLSVDRERSRADAPTLLASSPRGAARGRASDGDPPSACTLSASRASRRLAIQDVERCIVVLVHLIVACAQRDGPGELSPSAEAGARAGRSAALSHQQEVGVGLVDGEEVGVGLVDGDEADSNAAAITEAETRAQAGALRRAQVEGAWSLD